MATRTKNKTMATNTKYRTVATDRARSEIEIGRRLALARLATGLNQQGYARGAGIAQNTYNQYERGESRPAIDNAIRLADTYKLTLDFIYLGETSGLPPELLAAITALRKTRRDV